ncbi:MAG TPA: ABC transporter permease [Streptosporangiaceae bacterium]|jgi:peptide/nickel transport system permease protein|nr:ABC transporter permease [Streptosporangiaceae bacterium]
MRRIVINRLFGAVIQVLIVTLLAWLLFYVIAKFTGASPAQRIAGKEASPQQIALVARELGLNKPYWQQYVIFMDHLIHGNFGFSYVQMRPVSQILWPATRATASLVGGAAVIWLLVAAPIGGYGGLRPRSIGDITGRVLAILGMSIPVFWLAPLVSYIFGYQPTQGEFLGLHFLPVGTSVFPIQGYVDFGQNPIQWAYHLILPWITLAVGFAAVYIRFIRTMTAEQLGEDYARTARAKGASTPRVLITHVGRNIAPTVTVLLGADIATALTGVFFVETVFGIPGLGYTGLSAIENLDYPVITAVIIVAAIIAVLANTVVDLLHGVLDPRLRRASGV